MKKNKLGFTLIELLASLALLTVILTIAILSVTSIQTAVKKHQKENLKKYIITIAQKYISDTSLTKVYVDTLISEGLLVADNENKIIYEQSINKRGIVTFSCNGKLLYSAYNPQKEANNYLTFEKK